MDVTRRYGPGVGAAAISAFLLAACASASPTAGPSASTSATPLAIESAHGLATASPLPSVSGIVLDPTAWIVYGTCNKCDFTDDQIWVVHPDGSSDHQVGASLGGDVAHPALSHDGRQVALAWNAKDVDPLQIVVAGVDGSTPRAVTTCAPQVCLGYDGPAWSPDDTRIAVQMDFGPPQNDLPVANGIGILDLATGKIALVTRQAATDGQELRPRWSPDGKQLVYWTDRGLPDGTEQGALFIVNADGTDLRQLTAWDEDAGDPDWSPDGKLILYTTHSFHIDWHGTVESELITIQPDGTGRTALTSFGLGGPRADYARWTPDGSAIIYVRELTGHWRHIWVIGADGGNDSPVLTTRDIYGNPGLEP